jgi:hypothetical protein
MLCWQLCNCSQNGPVPKLHSSWKHHLSKPIINIEQQTNSRSGTAYNHGSVSYDRHINTQRQTNYRTYSIVSWPFSDSPLPENAPQLRIPVIHKGLILLVSFTSSACKPYSTDPVVVFCVDFIVGKTCIVQCVPFYLSVFNMKHNYYTTEFKKRCLPLQKKHWILLRNGIRGQRN